MPLGGKGIIHNRLCMRLLHTSLTPSEPQLIHCLPDQIKSGSQCLSLFFHEVDLIALQGLSVHAALIRGLYSDRADCRMTLWLPSEAEPFVCLVLITPNKEAVMMIRQTLVCEH